jgi:hypothetical protein
MSLAFSQITPNPSGDACFTTIDPRNARAGAPARMADGRLMTDYRPRCHQYPVIAAATFGDNEYRSRMVKGANELMSVARDLNNRKNTAISCEDTMVPELYKRVCTWNGCKTVAGNFQGIGTGRIYVPTSVGSASDPQALSDMNVPAIPLTFPRAPPRVGSHCAVGDAETAWALHGDAARYGSAAKSHPYSAPRS